MLTIHPQYLTLAKLCDGRLFRIPEYQRAYSWTTSERRDLFDDILKTHKMGDDAGHFMAAAVCLRRKKQQLGTDEFFVLDVVDGQQRLTTLIVLLNAILRSLNKKDKGEEKLHRELSELLVKDGDELLLLQTNHDSSHYFSNYLRRGKIESPKKAKTIADREILKAIAECRDFVTEWKEAGGSLLSLAALLKNRLFFLIHEIEDERTVYTVFEVLNSRGLEVSWLDRLKSILMGSAFELKNSNQQGVIDDLHVIWRDIYAVIGLRHGMSTQALRFAATLREKNAPRRPLGEKDSVEALRNDTTDAKAIREVAKWLLDVTRASDAVIANPRISSVTRISQARLLATAIHLREDFSEEEKDQLLRRWEKVTFRIYGMLGYDARTRVGDYVRLAWKVANHSLSVAQIDDEICEIGREFSIEDAVANLQATDCYTGWETELRYLFFRYEEYLASSHDMNFKNEQWEKIWMVSPSDSIEHIWPRSTSPKRHRHRLGNLVLLPPKLNSKLQALSPTDKAAEYRKTGLLIASQVADLIEESGWNGRVIDQREEELLTWAAEEWAD